MCASIINVKDSIPNKNRTGSSYPLSILSKKFIEYCRNIRGLVLDIGVGYGAEYYDTASIEALKTGVKVIACDIEKKHLNSLCLKAQQLKLAKNLCTVHKAFPQEITEIKQASLDAVHVSYVFDLMSIDSLLRSFAKIYELLKPGGKFFSVEYTPYNKTIEKFIPEYERNCKQNKKWPGFVSDISLYCTDCDNLPKAINHLDIDVMRVLTKKYGFYIEELHYLRGDKAIPLHMRLDGRESIGLIARK